MDSNLQKYRAFAAAVEQGSFTKAAQTLNYTQSGVSRMISDLEKEWGLELLERGKSGVRLTSDGRKLLPLVKNICREYEKLLTRVNEIKGLKFRSDPDRSFFMRGFLLASEYCQRISERLPGY